MTNPVIYGGPKTSVVVGPPEMSSPQVRRNGGFWPAKISVRSLRMFCQELALIIPPRNFIQAGCLAWDLEALLNVNPPERLQKNESQIFVILIFVMLLFLILIFLFKLLFSVVLLMSSFLPFSLLLLNQEFCWG